jgi:hypothetical protein
MFEFTFTETQSVKANYEVHVNAGGFPVELIPETTIGTLRIGRFDIFRNVVGQVFRTPRGEEIGQIAEIRRGLRLSEVWIAPTGLIFRARARYEYKPVVFTDWSRPTSAQDDRVVRVSATAKVARRRVVD